VPEHKEDSNVCAVVRVGEKQRHGNLLCSSCIIVVIEQCRRRKVILLKHFNVLE
jgi:hypothetical protein